MVMWSLDWLTLTEWAAEGFTLIYVKTDISRAEREVTLVNFDVSIIDFIYKEWIMGLHVYK